MTKSTRNGSIARGSKSGGTDMTRLAYLALGIFAGVVITLSLRREPTTEAGRALLDELTGALARRSILAIEREAVAQERARLRAAVEGLDETVTPGDMGWRPVPGSVSRAAVLRLLDPEAEGGTP